MQCLLLIITLPKNVSKYYVHRCISQTIKFFLLYLQNSKRNEIKISEGETQRFSVNTFYDTSKELQNYNRKLFLCPPQK